MAKLAPTVPEDALGIKTDMPKGVPTDAILCAVSRADAILTLLSSQFEGEGSQVYSHEIIANALWSISGCLEQINLLVMHADATSQPREEG